MVVRWRQARATDPGARMIQTQFALGLIRRCRRIIDRDLVARIWHMNRHLEHVRITVSAFRKRVRRVDLVVHNVIALRDTGDVDPLAAKLFEIPIGPATGNSLERASVTVALVIVRILQ